MIDNIKGLGGAGLPGVTPPGGEKPGGEKVDFSKLLKDTINKVNTAQKDAGKSVEKLAEGEASLHETMIAIEKAGVSFQLMVQVRNKIVSAYEEVMRTQV